MSRKKISKSVREKRKWTHECVTLPNKSWKTLTPIHPTFFLLADTCGDNCFDFVENYLTWESPGIGKYLVFMAMQCVVYFVFIFLVESGSLNRFFYFITNIGGSSVGTSAADRHEQGYGEEEEDSDVREERERVNNTTLNNLMKTDSLIIRNISKNYDNLKAVKNISVGVSPQECFGLLGQNGAGKTSTFKMLTGDQIVSHGNAYVNTHSILNQIRQVSCYHGDRTVQSLVT